MNMLQRLDRTNDMFENDLMMISSRRFKTRFAQFCCHYLKKVFFITGMICFSLLQITIAIFKGRSGLFNCVMSQMIGVWWALHMFYFYRKAIQIHIRSILEFNQEFKEEHMIQHSHNLTRYCWRMFIAWAVFNVAIQVGLHLVFE